jgi:hypothetical protein
MRRRAAARVAWSACALSLALTMLSLVLLILNLSHPEVPVYSFWIENVLFSVGFSIVGAVIVPRVPPGNPVGWLFCAIGLLWAVAHFSAEYAIYALLSAPGSLPAGGVVSWFFSWPRSWPWALWRSWSFSSPMGGCPVIAGGGSHVLARS